MAIECSPGALADASECYKKIPPGDRDAALIYLLYVISGSSLTISELAQASACYTSLDKQTSQAVIVYLLCQISNA